MSERLIDSSIRFGGDEMEKREEYAESNSLLKSLAEERRKRRRVPSAGQSVEADSRVEDGVRNSSKRAKSESEGCESHVKILETGSESSSCDKDVLLAQLISMGYPFEACSTALETSSSLEEATESLQQRYFVDGRPRTVGDLLKGEFEEMSESSTHSNRKRSGRLSCKLDDDLLEEIGIGDSDHARSCLGLGSAPASYQTRIFDGKSMLVNRVAADPTEMPGHVVPFAEAFTTVPGSNQRIKSMIITAMVTNVPFFELMMKYAALDVKAAVCLVGDSNYIARNAQLKLKTASNGNVVRWNSQQNGLLHAKIMLIEYGTGCRVVVSSGNLIPNDWVHVRNVWWAQDFPLRELSDDSSPTVVAQDWIDMLPNFLAALGAPLVDLSLYDFSACRADLVLSQPGRFGGLALDKYGHMRIRHLISSRGLQWRHNLTNSPLMCYASSVGKYSVEWLYELIRSFAGHPDKSPPAKDVSRSLVNGIDSSFVSLCDLRLLELTTDMESSKIEGVDQFFFPANIFRNPLFAGLIRDEIPAYGPPIGEWPMSHAKVITRYDPSPGDDNLAMVLYVGSHNASGSAWGFLANKKDRKLVVRNWEAGVLLQTRSVTEAESWRKAIPFVVPGPLMDAGNGGNEPFFLSGMLNQHFSQPDPSIPPRIETYARERTKWRKQRNYSVSLQRYDKFVLEYP